MAATRVDIMAAKPNNLYIKGMMLDEGTIAEQIWEESQRVKAIERNQNVV